VQRLVPAIIEAWRAAEREMGTIDPADPRATELSQRIHVLQEEHALAVGHDADREMVARFLSQHGLASIVPDLPSGST
jgi:hypothetical protein